MVTVNGFTVGRYVSRNTLSGFKTHINLKIVKWRNGKRCVCSIRHQYEAVKILHVGLRKLVTGSNPVLTTTEWLVLDIKSKRKYKYAFIAQW